MSDNSPLLAVQLALLLSCLGLSLFSWRAFRAREKHSLRSVAILVLGDIGRSPRMMYHAQSFAENGFVTDLIGCAGSKPIPSLGRLPRVRIHHIAQLPKIFNHLPFLVLAPIKIVHQVISILLCLLVWIDVPPEFILVQNPPSIPTLALVQLVGRIRGSKIIIDWHNLGYSILAMRLGKTHILVRIAKRFEAAFGYSAYAHLFVTQAMRDFLVKEWDLQGHKVVLYDRPPRHFSRSSTQETHELFCKLQPTLSLNKSLRNFLPDASAPYSTFFTRISSPPASSAQAKAKATAQEPVPTFTELGSPTPRPDRPALLVSSTSWTPDEDFSVLLEALSAYEKRAEELERAPRKGAGSDLDVRLPKVLVIVTGKGPLRDKYMAQVEKLQEGWKWVRCISLWLEAEDYPVLLGSSDLGVSLHSSSSALDLPMKVIDMFGCGLPVCALDFECLHELVKNGKNGLVFQSASQLALQFEELFLSFPDAPYLRSMKSNLANLPRDSTPASNTSNIPKLAEDEDGWAWSTWEDNWARVVRPLILSDVNL